jgi:hypothetical protein
MEDVDDVQHHRLGVSSAAGEAPAEAGEVRLAAVAQAHQLAVERDATLAQRLGDRCQFGKVPRAFATRARPQRDRPAVVAKLRAAAVPFSPRASTLPRRAPGQV